MELHGLHNEYCGGVNIGQIAIPIPSIKRQKRKKIQKDNKKTKSKYWSNSKHILTTAMQAILIPSIKRQKKTIKRQKVNIGQIANTF